MSKEIIESQEATEPKKSKNIIEDSAVETLRKKYEKEIEARKVAEMKAAEEEKKRQDTEGLMVRAFAEIKDLISTKKDETKSPEAKSAISELMSYFN